MSMIYNPLYGWISEDGSRQTTPYIDRYDPKTKTYYRYNRYSSTPKKLIVKKGSRYKVSDMLGRPGYINTDGTYTYHDPRTVKAFKNAQEVYKYYRNSNNKSFDLVADYAKKHRDYYTRAVRKIEGNHSFGKYSVVKGKIKDRYIPNFGPTITLTDNSKVYKKFRGASVPTNLIDSIAAHKPKGADIYELLVVPGQETLFGWNTNMPENQGLTKATLNDHSYALGSRDVNGNLIKDSYQSALRHALRSAGYREHPTNKGNAPLIDYVINHPNQFTNDPRYQKANDILIEDAIPSRLATYQNFDLAPLSNPWDHFIGVYQSGHYNDGEPGYNAARKVDANELRTYPALVDYINNKGYNR